MVNMERVVEKGKRQGKRKGLVRREMGLKK